MDNNSSYNRIYTTPDLSLVIKNLNNTDAGIYLCHGKEGQEVENKFNYRIEPIFKEHGVVYVEQGNITDWEKYREIYLASVTMRFAISQMSELAEIREVGIILQVTSEWASWGPCEHCIDNRGYRSSVGNCRLKRKINMGNSRYESIMEKGCDYIGKGCSTILSKIGSRSSGDSRCLWNALSDRCFDRGRRKLHMLC
ncbi:uncharacterized protein LOC102678334 [Apis dorsata]|uniref:uncharacterized protein LOC102678334 n=1 Tax=Apis dorsata TaxID=7462 RepID=UPI001293615B|nr:uncharacterized protein LOC102678334 [Apis dorsata]